LQDTIALILQRDIFMLNPVFFRKMVIFTNYSLNFAANELLNMQHLYRLYTYTTITMTMTPWGVR